MTWALYIQIKTGRKAGGKCRAHLILTSENQDFFYSFNSHSLVCTLLTNPEPYACTKPLYV